MLYCQNSLVHDVILSKGKTNLSHDGLNPAHVPFPGEQSDVSCILLQDVKKSRHRRIKKRSR